MKPLPKPKSRRDIRAEQDAANLLVKRIRKLRWIGMEEEARRLELASRCLLSTNAVLTGQFDTD